MLDCYPNTSVTSTEPSNDSIVYVVHERKPFYSEKELKEIAKNINILYQKGPIEATSFQWTMQDDSGFLWTILERQILSMSCYPQYFVRNLSS